MTRLIDADELKLSFCRECTLYPDKCLEETGDGCDWHVIWHINMMKTIDAEPVKHGEWILDGGTPICSVCHEEPCWSSEGYDFTDYCPNCGAKMDKGGDTE